MKNVTKITPKASQPIICKNPYFSKLFQKLDFWMHFGRPLAHVWLPFGSPWLHFGSLWLPSGSFLVRFGSLLAPLGSLLLTVALDFLTFAVFWRHFWYFLEFLMEILCKSIFFENTNWNSACFFRLLRHFQKWILPDSINEIRWLWCRYPFWLKPSKTAYVRICPFPICLIFICLFLVSFIFWGRRHEALALN